MQIRGQLRNNAVSFGEPLKACCTAQEAMDRDPSFYIPWDPTCKSGYHGIHSRVRFKARSQHHGNATGQSKGGQ
jgi:hypothetical protein